MGSDDDLAGVSSSVVSSILLRELEIRSGLAFASSDQIASVVAWSEDDGAASSSCGSGRGWGNGMGFDEDLAGGTSMLLCDDEIGAELVDVSQDQTTSLLAEYEDDGAAASE